MFYCLDGEELNELIDYKFTNVALENNDLRLRIENAESWQDDICVLAYTLSFLLLNRTKRGENCQDILALAYNLENDMSCFIHEIDYRFVDYMLSHTREDGFSLEENLISLANNLGRHIYDNVIRY